MRYLLKAQRTRGVTVDSGEIKIHSFIVKVWLEESEEHPDLTLLHGHMTHVPSGERHYIRRVSEIPLFIRSHLQRMGIRLQSDPWVPPWMRLAAESLRKSLGRWVTMTRASAPPETREEWGRRSPLTEAGGIEDRDGDVCGAVPSGREVRHEV